MPFSTVVIARNEAKTLPRLVKSLGDFQKRGGEIVVVDTGSTDDTIQIARNLGCKVFEEGTRFIETIDLSTASAINAEFVAGGESSIVSAGDKLFNYTAARNYAASVARNDVISMPDCDEIWTKLDMDAVERAIVDGTQRFEYNFVFSHDQFGGELVKFLHSKFYDRRAFHWVGIVHEVLAGEGKTQRFGEDVMKLEHWQNESTNRAGYLKGLALDCYRNPTNDRNSHYFARELMWSNRPQSAITEFRRHIAMNKWPAEAAQSMIFIGDCYMALNMADTGISWYHKAFEKDGGRRESLLRLATHYWKKNDHQRAAAYAAASLTIKWDGYYGNNSAEYAQIPHEILYWALWYLGDREESKKHWEKCIEFQPKNPKYIADAQFYKDFDYQETGIAGWMTEEELRWLHDTAEKMTSVVEIGSWKGRSTHALLTGCPGTVTACDTWQGSVDETDWSHDLGKNQDVFAQFMKNVGHFKNLEVLRMPSVEGAKECEGRKFDLVFIDAGHTYEEVKEDILAWKDKAGIILAGHDYTNIPAVKQAVDELLGEVQVCDRIWYKYVANPTVSIVIPTLGREDQLKECLDLIAENADYKPYEIIVLHDDWPPNNTGVPKLVKKGVEQSKGELVFFLGNDCKPQPGFLREAVKAMLEKFPQLDGLVAINDKWTPWELATHWLGGKKLLPLIGGEFFHTGYHHTCCDDELTKRCKALGKYYTAEKCVVIHDHPINKKKSSLEYDELRAADPVYNIAYNEANRLADRALFEQRQANGFK